MNANQMKSFLSEKEKCLNHVFLPEKLKNYQDGKKPVLRHGKAYSKVRGTKLRIGEQKDSATVQSLNPLSN